MLLDGGGGVEDKVVVPNTHNNSTTTQVVGAKLKNIFALRVDNATKRKGNLSGSPVGGWPNTCWKRIALVPDKERGETMRA